VLNVKVFTPRRATPSLVLLSLGVGELNKPLDLGDR
jgi:hypothetical protein